MVAFGVIFMEPDSRKNERTLLQIIICASTVAVAGCLALLFAFDNSGGQTRYEFKLASVIAFLVGIGGMVWFWRKVLTLSNQPRRMWRFIIISSIVFIIAFIGCIFLPQFRPASVNSSDLLQGLILGFLAVGFVFFIAYKTMQLFEGDQDDNLK